ncbi:hypothetical protein [Oceanobacillus chungangensis]|uniref:DUF3906 domain-containing protein n=1 Tax=Oceanobacillus chungangensis TaxID=1229152 RepID=A0A3D8PL95_9BACI|nr:hypothetical protein [Oceanobacillus chungangensis]RDW16886.1 hypothetical protein CWR45_13850 [Oceanobacillus chungangensis]
MKKQYEVTFTMINGEVGHLIEETNLTRARNSIKNQFEDNIDSPVLVLTDDLVLVKANVQYFVVKEYEG